jgi:hypothetical protein
LRACRKINLFDESDTSVSYCHFIQYGDNSRVLRRIFGPEREEVTGGWKRLHNEELLRSLYALLNVISAVKSRRMKWAVHVAHMGEVRNVYKILVAKPEGKRLFGRIRHRLKDNIRMDLREIGWEGMKWVHLAQDRDQ